MYEEIEARPMRYRSLVGDMGTTLSGGQQQRVMLACALYRQPLILMLDEGTIALDIATGRRLSAELKGMGMTSIVAAHRPETLASVDRVVGLEAGPVPVKFELRPVPAAEVEEAATAAQDHYTDGIGLLHDRFEA